MQLKAQISSKQIDKLRRETSAWAKKKKEEVKIVVATSTLAIETAAKRNAPVNKEVGLGGGLRAALHSTFAKDGLGGKVSVDTVDYGPYVEFGTGNLVDVPQGLKEFALQFKGQGIREVNLKPQPFLFPAVEEERPKFLDKIRKILRRV